MDTTVTPKEPILQQIQISSCPGGTGGAQRLQPGSSDSKQSSEDGSGTCEELLPASAVTPGEVPKLQTPRLVHPPGAPSVLVSVRQEREWKVFSKRTPEKREIGILREKGTFQLYLISITATSSHCRIPTSPILRALIPN